jgi:galactonate dehydratase
MKITDVRLYLTSEVRSAGVFIAIETDTGIVGYGEGTNHFLPQAAYGMLKDLTPYLIGEDPERIEYLWQSCFRRRFYRSGVATGCALSAIDMALWDIKGKAHGVPVYQLLGGLARERVRLYAGITGRSPQEMANAALAQVAKGFTAVRFRAFHTYDDIEIHDFKLAVNQQLEYLEALRAAVGEDVDIVLECHGRYDPEWALKLAKEAEKFHPFMMEDPTRHENPQAMAQLRTHTSLPLAQGERYHNKWDYRELVVNGYVNYLRPDICHCGGISEMRKISALAEAYLINVIPHNNAGPLGSAATVHAALAIPNIALCEGGGMAGSGKTDIVWPFPKMVDGYALPPEGPGLGIQFDEKLAASKPFVEHLQPKLKALDGSVRDF